MAAELARTLEIINYYGMDERDSQPPPRRPQSKLYAAG